MSIHYKGWITQARKPTTNPHFTFISNPQKWVLHITMPLRESIPRLFNGGKTTMTTRCAPACSQALPVKPQGVWARGIEAWARSRDLRKLEFRRWGSSGPSSLILSWLPQTTATWLFVQQLTQANHKSNIKVNITGSLPLVTYGLSSQRVCVCDIITWLCGFWRHMTSFFPWQRA